MKLFPVVHINAPERAIAESEAALDLGADGVYLIDHHGSSQVVMKTLDDLHERRPDDFIGINLLGRSALEVVQLLRQRSLAGTGHTPSAIWVDDIRSQQEWASDIPKRLKDSDETLSQVKILGGIAFKYTRTFTEAPRAAARETRSLRKAVDVVTTSGSGTGTPPTPNKLRAMKAAAGGRSLAVASGISIGNIADYQGIVDEVLVASSVETAPYSGVFDREKLAALIERAHELD